MFLLDELGEEDSLVDVRWLKSAVVIARGSSNPEASCLVIYRVSG